MAPRSVGAIAAFLAALVLSSSTTRQASAQGSDPFIAWASRWGDPNHQGVYTCEQWKKYATDTFNAADRNRDGFLDAREFEAIRKADPMFKDADLGYFDDNRDGRVSRSEFVEKPNPLFARYDRKGNCRVTLDDIVNTLSATQRPPQQRGR